MELEFNKSTIAYLRSVAGEVKDQEETGEIRVPDGLPDVGRVLCSWGQALIRTKEWRGNGMTASGGILVKVLYEAEGEEGLHCVESWLPFQTKWEFSQTEKDGYIRIIPQVTSVEARMASSRKLIVCARISIDGKAMVSDQISISTGADLPPDVQMLKNTYPLQLPVEAGEKVFSSEDVIPYPPGMPLLAQLVSYTAVPVLSETKLMGDKIVFRGCSKLRFVYLDTSGILHTFNHEVPFSQYTQLDGQYDDNAEITIDFALTGLEIEQGEGDAYNCKIGIAAQYLVCVRTITEIVEDVFSPVRKISCKFEELNIPSVLNRREIPVEPSCSLPVEMDQIVDAIFNPGIPCRFTENGDMYADLSGTFQVLGTDVMGRISAVTERWMQSVPLNDDVHTIVEMRFKPNNDTACGMNGSSSFVSTELPLEIVILNQKPIPMVTNVEIGEPVRQDPDRPSVILRKAGEDSLWKIAKDAGSSVEAIRMANGIEGELEPERIILIPVT